MAPVFLLAALTLVGCSAQDVVAGDTEYRQRILGTWFQEQRFPEGVVIERTFTYHSDGTYDSSANRIDKQRIDPYRTKGRWKIENGVLSYTILESTHPRIPVGYESSSKIVRISSTEKVVEEADGQLTTSRRVDSRRK
jgi:uncharacterized protein YcfL